MLGTLGGSSSDYPLRTGSEEDARDVSEDKTHDDQLTPVLYQARDGIRATSNNEAVETVDADREEYEEANDARDAQRAIPWFLP
jgi:hypothetical protein